MSDLQTFGNMGLYLEDNNAISFQVGTDPTMRIGVDPDDSVIYGNRPELLMPRWLSVDGYNVLARGKDNRKCEQIEKDIKNNRLLPRLISKQVNMLYGKGPHVYRNEIKDNKILRCWESEPRIQAWLEGWKRNGMEMGYKDFGMAVIKRYYFFRDFFVKVRFSRGKRIGAAPIAGLEIVENKLCRLATMRQDVATDIILYNDFRHVVVGAWNYGAANFRVYPLYRENETDDYHYAAISHHRESSIGSHYGENETHEGVKIHLKTSNELPQYIDSFLNNSLAAKVHVIIPAAWVESKRKQIKALCEENKSRRKEDKPLLKYNDIEIGAEFRESLIVQYMKEELRRFSQYLSGRNAQGKAFSSVSFRQGQAEAEERWKIETIDLKYKEYISALTEYDKHINDVLLASVGMDASISAISKEGMMSKSGSDAYYNYLIYLISLTPDDEKCSEPYNDALALNFPDLYREGLRIGFYREAPARQEEVSAGDRLNTQQP